MKKIIIILILSIGSNSFGASDDDEAGSQQLKERGFLCLQFQKNQLEQQQLAEEILNTKRMITDNPLVVRRTLDYKLSYLHRDLLSLTFDAKRMVGQASEVGMVLTDAELGWDIIDQQRLKDQQVAQQRLKENSDCLNDCCDKLFLGSNSFGASDDVEAGSQQSEEQGFLYKEFRRNQFKQRQSAEKILIIKKMIADNPLVGRRHLDYTLSYLHEDLLFLAVDAQRMVRQASQFEIVLRGAELGWDIIDQQRLKDQQIAQQRLKAQQEADQRLKDQQIAQQRLQENSDCLNDCCDKLFQCLKFLLNSTKKNEVRFGEINS